ncbi:MAG TPA: hypothetical protein VFV09_08810 [Actinomycetota bacterium]|jgi:hypothetical protein|nr:hypothetical protein [Actinomycetota bacterium]
MTTQLLTGPAPVQVVDLPTHTEISEVFVPPGFGSRLPSNAAGRTPWVVVDRAWARRLGVQRTNGAYRINRRELVARLAEAETAALLKAGNGSHLVSAA